MALSVRCQHATTRPSRASVRVSKAVLAHATPSIASAARAEPVVAAGGLRQQMRRPKTDSRGLMGAQVPDAE
jgi:hypothetical protein